MFLFLYVLAPIHLHADGPHIEFHSAEGPCSVTLFSAPDPLVTGPVQLVLLVQRTSGGALVHGASATGSLALPGHPAIPLHFALGDGGNAQLPGVEVTIPSPGSWSAALTLAVPGTPVEHFNFPVAVAVNHGKRNSVLLAVSALAIVVLLFLGNQRGKAKLRPQAS